MKHTLRNPLRFGAIAILALVAFSLVAGVAAHLGTHPQDLMLLGVGMTTLAIDKARPFELGDRNHVPVIAADIIYEGSAVGDNGSGYGRPLVAGDPFRGFAVAQADNSAGAAGAKYVEVKHEGRVQLAVTSVAITDVGKAVYASDDDAFVLTATSNSFVGRVVRFISSGVCIVEFNVSKGELGSFTALTDSSGGTASDTIAAISGAYTQSEIRNGFASLAAKINAIQKMLA